MGLEKSPNMEKSTNLEKSPNMEKGAPMSRRFKMVTSAAIWFGTFSLGICNGLIGPALVEFSIRFDTSVAAVSTVFSIHTVAMIVGALLCGVVFNRVNRQLASSALIIVMGITTIILPTVPSLALFFVVSFIQVVCWAGYDTSQIVWMIELWEGDAAAYIQMQHFSFAAGALVSPIIVKPFLPDADDQHIFKSLSNSTEISNSIQSPSSLPRGTPTAPLLYVPFVIGGAIMILSGLFISILYKIKRYERPTTRAMGTDDAKTSRARHILLLVLSALFLGFHCGQEGSTFHFLAAFSQFVNLRLSQAEGAGVLCYFTGAYTAGRAIGIGIVLRTPSEILLSGNLLLCIVGNCFLYLANNSIMAMHASALLLGLGYSTVFAGYFGFIEKYLEVGNVEGAILIAATSALQSFYPLVIGHFIEAEPLVLLIAHVFSLVIVTTLFIVIWCIVKNKGRPQQNFKLEIQK